MRRFVLVIFAVTLMACQNRGGPPAEAYRSWTDQWIVRLGLPLVPCRSQDDVDECYRTLPAEHWHGAWVLGPEEHMEYFCPNQDACAWDKKPSFDLSWNRRVFIGRPQVEADWGKRYAVDFVGRRTAYANQYFDSGGQQYLIIVDRLISMKELGASPAE